MAFQPICGVCRVINGVGQSNLVGQGGQPNKPDSLLVGLEQVFTKGYSSACYSERIINNRLLDEGSNDYVVRDIPALDVVQPYQAWPYNGFFGVEIFFLRYLTAMRPASWSADDRIIFRKFGAGGTGMRRIIPSDTTGWHFLYNEWLDEQDEFLETLDCEISHEGTILIQGEANSTQGAANYVSQVDQLMAYLQGRGYSNKLVWPQLREDVNGPQTAQLNANMVASPYCTTVPNNDLPMLPNENHQTALGYKELAKRLYNAYIGYPIL